MWLKKKNINPSDVLGGFRAKDPSVKAFPKSAQDVIDIVKVAENGIFELPGKRFSATYEIDDINYMLENEDGRDELLYNYATKVINPLQCPFKITLINKKKDIQTMEEEYLYPEKEDEYQELREYVNMETLRRITKSRKGYTQHKYITVTTEVGKLENMELKFQPITNDLSLGMGELNAGITQLNGDERLNLIRSIIQPDATMNMPSISTLIGKNRSFYDELVNMEGFDFTDNGKYECFRIGKKHCTALYASSYPDILSDEFVDKLMNYPIESIVSIDVVPIPGKSGRKYIDSIYEAVENKIQKQQKYRNKNRDYSSDISKSVRDEKEEVEKFINQSRESSEKMFLCGLTIILMADTKSELLSAADNIKVLGDKEQVRIENAWMWQKESFLTALPIGNRYIENLRVMFTSDIATLCPFQSAKLNVKGTKMCYGVDRISDEVIMGNRKALTFGGGFYFGKPGTGKSQDAKWEMANVLVGTDDVIICIDPSLEYTQQKKIFNGEFFNFSPGSRNYINPLDCDYSIFDSDKFDEFIDSTSDYMLAIFAAIMHEELESGHNTIISRCVRRLYEKIAALPKEKRFIPIMSDLKDVFDEQPEPQAADLSLALELFTTGAFQMFNHHTNVNLNSRFTCFGIRDVGKRLYGLAMITINRYIDKKVLENFEKGITTRIYYDEIQYILKSEESSAYLDDSWRNHRKSNAIDTGMTHTIEKIVKNPIAEDIVKNSEFLFILKSSKASAKALLDNIEGMKNDYFRFILNAPIGYGLIKHGKEIIPIDATMDEENPLMRIFNTDPHKYREDDDS